MVSAGWAGDYNSLECQFTGKMEQIFPRKYNHHRLTPNGTARQFCFCSRLVLTSPEWSNHNYWLCWFLESVITEQGSCFSLQWWSVTWNCELTQSFHPWVSSCLVFCHSSGHGRRGAWASQQCLWDPSCSSGSHLFLISENKAAT